MSIGDRQGTHNAPVKLGQSVIGVCECVRCRDCEGCPEPIQTHFTCIRTGAHKCSYSKACGERKLRPRPEPSERSAHKRLCLRCRAVDLSDRRPGVLYCDDCRRIVSNTTFATRTGLKKPAAKTQPQRKEAAVPATPNGTRRKWSKEDDALICTHALEGSAAIAEMLGGTTAKCVLQRASKLGVSLGGGRGHQSHRTPPPVAPQPEEEDVQPEAASDATVTAPLPEHPTPEDAPKPGPALADDPPGVYEVWECCVCHRKSDEKDTAVVWVRDNLCSDCADVMDGAKQEAAEATDARDEKLHGLVQEILEGENPLTTITVQDGGAARLHDLYAELIDTHLALIIASRPGDQLVCHSASRVRALTDGEA